MKKTILAAVVSLFANVAFQPSASANVQVPPFSTRPPVRGGETPFPFGREVPFPWNAMEGIWQIEDAQINGFYSFQVSRDPMGSSILKVLQIDADNGRVIGQGAGFANETQKVVRAVMKGKDSNFLIFVRVFRNLRIHNRIEQQAVVLSVRTFGSRQVQEREWHFLLNKVSNRPVQMRAR